MRTILLDHNKIAYRKVMAALDTSQRTCIVHPTGTGKSYIMAAVSEQFRRVLILGPNIFVLNQVHDVLRWRDRSKDGGRVDYMTYSWLTFNYATITTRYDLICLDEFHRTGAPEWGAAVDALLEVQPQAKVLGATATPVRYLDDGRDMADELFQGNVASSISLKEAWSRGILSTPRFVTGLFEFDKVVADAEERISKSRRLTDSEKKVRLTRINNLRLQWERSQGMPQILRKHIDPATRRLIIFCGNVGQLTDMERTVVGWFRKAGFSNIRSYCAHTYLSNKELREQMDQFEADDFDADHGIKLMLAVNMLNEGIHIPRVNAVLLLRTTSSKIIYLQQIGRCMTANKSERPIILDMVDNITTTSIVHDTRDDFDWYSHQHLGEADGHESSQQPFVVYDYTLGIQQAIAKLVPEGLVRLSAAERMPMFVDFCNKYHRLPVKTADYDDYLNMCALRKYHSEKPVPGFQELIDKYSRTYTYEQAKQQVLDYCIANGELPYKGRDAESNRLWRLIYRRIDQMKADADLAPYFKARNAEFVKEKKTQAVVDFVKEYQRIPSRKDGREIHNIWVSVSRYNADDERIIAIREKYGRTRHDSLESYMAQLVAFVEREGRAPNASNPDERKLYNNLVNLRKNHAEDARFLALMDKINSRPKLRECKVQENDNNVRAKIIAFVEKNRRLPLSTATDKDELDLYRQWYARRDRLCQDDAAMQAIRDQYGRSPVKCQERLQTVRLFAETNDRLPRKTDGPVFTAYETLRRNYISDPAVRALLERYGYKPQSDEARAAVLNDRLDQIETFAADHGRLPTSAHSAEYRLARWWVDIKRRHGTHPRVTTLKEHYPLQNRR